MYAARIKLPCAVTEQETLQLQASMNELYETCAVVRENQDMTSPWILEIFTQQEPQLDHANDILSTTLETVTNQAEHQWSVDKLPDIDWLEHSYQQFTPFSIGPFFIYGSHYQGNLPEGQMALQIDAATAFGSGEHGTTKGCIEAMLDMKGSGICPWNILDMGTGSGILAIAAWKLWKTSILAVDIDPESVAVTKRHMQTNHVKEGSTAITCAQSDGFGSEIVEKKKPYELIIANILASTLRDMGQDIANVIDTNGYVILSGILEEQAQDIITLYKAHHLVLKKRYDIDGWSTLLLHNTAT